MKEIYNVPQISDRWLSQKKTINLHRNGKDNTMKGVLKVTKEQVLEVERYPTIASLMQSTM